MEAVAASAAMPSLGGFWDELSATTLDPAGFVAALKTPVAIATPTVVELCTRVFRVENNTSVLARAGRAVPAATRPPVRGTMSGAVLIADEERRVAASYSQGFSPRRSTVF